MLRSVLRDLLDLVIPPHCAFCGALMDHLGDGVCPVCRETLPLRPESQRLFPVGPLLCCAPLYYGGASRSGVRALKFHRKACRAPVFGRVIAWAVQKYMESPYDVVTYVPVSRQRKLSRGFDQAQLIALSVGESLGLPVVSTLQKVRHNPAQSSLSSAQERAKNVQGVYRPISGAPISGTHFLLIDDVCTTGSTLLSAAQVLLREGAASVVCGVLASGRPPQPRP